MTFWNALFHAPTYLKPNKRYSTRNVFVLCIYLRMKSDLCHLFYKLFGFYNLDEKSSCLHSSSVLIKNFIAQPMRII